MNVDTDADVDSRILPEGVDFAIDVYIDLIFGVGVAISFDDVSFYSVFAGTGRGS